MKIEWEPSLKTLPSMETNETILAVPVSNARQTSKCNYFFKKGSLCLYIEYEAASNSFCTHTLVSLACSMLKMNGYLLVYYLKVVPFTCA